MDREMRSDDAAGSFKRNEVERMKSVMQMKMFRTAAVLLCGAGLVVSAAVAQQDAAPPPPAGQQQGPPMGMGMGGRGAMDPQRHLEMMQKRLGLNDDQMTQVKAIFADGQAKMAALHQEQMTKMRAILTPDQQTKFDAMQARMKAHRGGMGPMGPMGGMGGNAPPPPAPAPAPQQ